MAYLGSPKRVFDTWYYYSCSTAVRVVLKQSLCSFAPSLVTPTTTAAADDTGIIGTTTARHRSRIRYWSKKVRCVTWLTSLSNKSRRFLIPGTWYLVVITAVVASVLQRSELQILIFAQLFKKVFAYRQIFCAGSQKSICLQTNIYIRVLLLGDLVIYQDDRWWSPVNTV